MERSVDDTCLSGGVHQLHGKPSAGRLRKPFLHAATCPASDVKVHHSWAALHQILDSARGVSCRLGLDLFY